MRVILQHSEISFGLLRQLPKSIFDVTNNADMDASSPNYLSAMSPPSPLSSPSVSPSYSAVQNPALHSIPRLQSSSFAAYAYSSTSPLPQVGTHQPYNAV
jgi:hypothetical protein